MATGETGIQTIVLHELTSRVVRKQLKLLIIDLKLPICRNVLKRYYRSSLTTLKMSYGYYMPHRIVVYPINYIAQLNFFCEKNTLFDLKVGPQWPDYGP